LGDADCVVLGASFDTPEENKEFAEAQHFGYRLLSDEDRTVGTAYEVTRPPDDERAGYALRIAYLIDPEGTIRKSYEVTDTGGFADEVLSDLRALAS
jgi:thioredoxin-dependent peroxiredoxin